MYYIDVKQSIFILQNPPAPLTVDFTLLASVIDNVLR